MYYSSYHNVDEFKHSLLYSRPLLKKK